MATHQYRACIVGCGRMGGTIDEEVQGTPHGALPYSHAAGYAAYQRTNLIAAADTVEEKAKYVCNKWNIPNYYLDYREMIRQEKPDIVSIATRPGNHAEITQFAAENGVKGIYCEKPLCPSMQEADTMLNICKKHNVKFNLGTQRRFTPGYLKMREILESGTLGNRRAIIAYTGGAALWGYTHTADLILFLASDSPIAYVQGNVIINDTDFQDNRTNNDPNIVMGFIQFQNGIHGISIPGTAYEFEVNCSQGTVRSLNNGLGFQLRKPQGQFNEILDAQFPPFQRKSGTVACIEDLVDAIDTDTQTQGNIQIAHRSTEIVLAIVESQRLHGKRVTIPLQNRALYLGRW